MNRELAKLAPNNTISYVFIASPSQTGMFAAAFFRENLD
jgi:hypothetical protein